MAIAGRTTCGDCILLSDPTGPTSRLEQIVELFRRHGVEFIIIGGQAEILLGGIRPTFDIDVCYRRTPENIRRLAAALAEIHPRLRGAPKDLPFQADAPTLAMGLNFTFETDIEDLDLLGEIEPIGDYEKALATAEWVPFGEKPLAVLSLDNLIRIKEHVRRPKDLASLYELYAIRKIRNEQQAP